MQRTANWLLWTVVIVIVMLAGLNWNTLFDPAPVNLMIAQFDAPLGLIMLSLSGTLIALFFFTTLRNQIGSLLETKRMNKEIRRLQGEEGSLASRELATLREQIQTQITPLQPIMLPPVELPVDRP